MAAMLHFERGAPRPPRLIVLDGGRSDRVDGRGRAGRLPLAWHGTVAPVLLVIAATILAVLVDLVDGVPAWSHLAVMTSAAVLATHGLLSRR